MANGRIARGALARAITSNRNVGRPAVVRQATGFLYSANLLPATLAVGDYPFFSTPIGQAGQGWASNLTRVETNLTQANRIPDKTAYSFREIGIYIRSTNTATASVTDVDLILHNCYLRIEKTEYVYIYAPLFLLPGGGGVFAPSVLAGSKITALSGMPTPGARVRLPTEVTLDPGEPFTFFLGCTRSATLTGITPQGETNTGVPVWCVLYGKSAAEIAP